MEYIIAAVVVVFLCLFCYRQGIKDGRALKENKPLEKIVKIPLEKKEKETKGELTLQEQLANLMAYPGDKA
jgi:hypothetical protein